MGDRNSTAGTAARLRRYAWVVIATALVAGGSSLAGAASAGGLAPSAPHVEARTPSAATPSAELASARASLGASSAGASPKAPLVHAKSPALNWTKIFYGTPAAAFGASLALDPATNQYLLYEGSAFTGPSPATWLLTLPTRWTPVGGSTAPSARVLPSMTYDAADGYFLLFGGENGLKALNDTWKFQNDKWTQLSPAKSPPRLFGAGMTYDAKDGYVVLFGGNTSLKGPSLGQTWTFKAGAWTQLSPTSSPSARWSPGVGYDAKDGYVLLFGGFAQPGSGALADTWNFSKGAWHKLSPATAPSARAGEALSYSPEDSKMVLSGGTSTFTIATPLSDVWTFGAGAWSQKVPAYVPSARFFAAAADGTAKSGALVFGGQGSIGYISDLWVYGKGKWLSLHPIQPAAREQAQMAYDSTDGYVLLYGGYNQTTSVIFADTWKFSVGVWTELSPTTSPGARAGASMADDPSDGYVLLFGGANGVTTPCGTWSFAHGKWTERLPGCRTGPGTRVYAGMTYDAADGYVLLFGGQNTTYGSLYQDTWAYSGGAWSLAALYTTYYPPALQGVELAYDDSDGYVLLFGGENLTGYQPDQTWVFVGGIWTNFTSFGSFTPISVAFGNLVYDTALGEVVLFGGLNTSYGLYNYTYSWTSSGWGVLYPTYSPPQTAWGVMAYDPNSGGVVAFGGYQYSFPFDYGSTWVLK